MVDLHIKAADLLFLLCADAAVRRNTEFGRLLCKFPPFLRWDNNNAISTLVIRNFVENIRVRTGCVIRQLKHRDGQFQDRTEEGDVITARRCILAAGGAAGAKLGGGMDGYQLARQLGHHRTVLYPSLVQVCTDPTYPRGLKGVKAQAALTLTREGETLTAGQGEVLFTEYGVSGPAVFDLSRAVY